MWRLIYLQKYGFIWYSTSILGSWNYHWLIQKWVLLQVNSWKHQFASYLLTNLKKRIGFFCFLEHVISLQSWRTFQMFDTFELLWTQSGRNSFLEESMVTKMSVMKQQKNRTPFLVQRNRPKKDTSSENMNVPSRRTINTNIETVYDIYIY